jgi:hypothetical protein
MIPLANQSLIKLLSAGWKKFLAAIRGGTNPAISHLGWLELERPHAVH